MAVGISLEHLTKTFTKDKNEFRAVDDVHLTIHKGELVTFLGPSGCGKTTTLRMIAGFENRIVDVDGFLKRLDFIGRNHAVQRGNLMLQVMAFYVNEVDDVFFNLKLLAVVFRHLQHGLFSISALRAASQPNST